MQDFTRQAVANTRNRAYVDALRKQALAMESPQGQMVSGHYVEPHWSEYLAKPLMAAMAGYQGRQVDDAEAATSAQQMEHAEQWRSSLPQAIQAKAGIPATPEQAATPFGVRDMPQQDAIPADPGAPPVPYQPVSTAARLKATLEGMRNPLIAKEAELWNQGQAEDLKREDDQAARRETLVLQLAQQAEIARQRSEDTRLGNEMRAEAARESRQLQERIAHLVASTRIQTAGMMAAVAGGNRASDANEKFSRGLERLSARVEPVADLMTAGQTLQDLFDKYGKRPIPGFGYVGVLPGAMLTAEGNANRAILKGFVNTIMRSNAGLSQTIAEQHNVNLETLADGKYTEEELRKVWPILRDKANEKHRGILAGFSPDVVETYRNNGGRADPIVSRAATPKTASTTAPPPAAKGWVVEEVRGK